MIKACRLIGPILLLALLAACKAVGPDFVTPLSGLPSGTFDHPQPPVADAVADLDEDVAGERPDWWASFHDPVLTALEARVATQNLDVRTATIRIAESRSQRGVTAAAELPSIDGQDKYQRELYSKNGILSLVDGLLGKLAPGTSLSLAPLSDFTVGADASWQLDLWGGVRRQIEAADAQTQESEDDRRAVLVASLAELASDYLNLRGVQALEQITNENLRAEQDILQLTRDRQQRGLTTGLDVESAASQVDAVRAQLPSLQQQASQKMNAISLLLDMAPNTLLEALGRLRPFPPTPAHVPLGVPSELARRRPDVREAEAHLHAATADIGVATAAFYPNVTLSGVLELDSLTLAKLFTPTSLQYMAGPTVTLPIFEGGRLKSTLQLRKAQQQEAALAYEKTVLQAWHEVVNTLVSLRSERDRRARLAEQIGHAREGLSLARARYLDGVADMTTVLDLERTLLQSQQQYVESTTNLALDLVALYKALGGGWQDVYPALPPSVLELSASESAATAKTGPGL